jgi:hypothetical protein
MILYLQNTEGVGVDVEIWGNVKWVEFWKHLRIYTYISTHLQHLQHLQQYIEPYIIQSFGNIPSRLWVCGYQAMCCLGLGLGLGIGLGTNEYIVYYVMIIKI